MKRCSQSATLARSLRRPFGNFSRSRAILKRLNNYAPPGCIGLNARERTQKRLKNRSPARSSRSPAHCPLSLGSKPKKTHDCGRKGERLGIQKNRVRGCRRGRGQEADSSRGAWPSSEIGRASCRERV